MSNDTVEQELADCWYGRGIYQPGNADKAMDKFLSRNIVIRKPDMPEAQISDDYVWFDGEVWVSVAAQPERLRRQAMKDLAAADAIEAAAVEKIAKEAERRAQEAEKTAARDKRREEVAAEFWPYIGYYGALSKYAKNAVDRIIALEAGK